MRKYYSIIVLFLFVLNAGAQKNDVLIASAAEVLRDGKNAPYFIHLKSDAAIGESDALKAINAMIRGNGSTGAIATGTRTDRYGYMHTSYDLNYKGVPADGKMIIAHFKDGKLVSLNGDLIAIEDPLNSISLNEQACLQKALEKIGAVKYKWENDIETNHMREVLGLPEFSYFPKGELVITEKEGKFFYAWKFNIYAEEPLYRANIFVNAGNGEILEEQNLICEVDVPGTALTKYSGVQSFTCDQNGAIYRLRESQRGLGVETYNLKNTTTYASNDFTNTSASWTATGPDQGATDAHWGAEMTYDYFLQKFNRNSIDNSGFKLLSYVHYGNSYNNAFWDGQRMTYGDGNGSVFTIMTALDICGHEITHGLVANTGKLGGGTSEAAALNESFADIFGTSIEKHTRPTNWNWKIGSEVTPNGNGIRNMQNPKSLNDPHTYHGQYWDQGGEPHANAGPSNYWFYLLVNGGSGTNDNNHSYNVSGIGHDDAEAIAYRALTVYFVPGTNYSSARNYAIQAAKDLFGVCSNQAIQTANAWYAVGVGPQIIPGVVGPDFAASATDFCTLPASVSFKNLTSNGSSYSWDFGDGNTSTSANPVHTFTANGTYNIKLKASGCPNASDSLIKTALIVVNVPQQPVAGGAQICANSKTTLNANANAPVFWYAGPTSTTVLHTGNTFTTPTLSGGTTYYAATTVTSAPVSGGRLTNTNGGYLGNASQWLIFDVNQSSRLNSVVVYAQNAGNRTIELRNSSNVVLSSTMVPLSAGPNTVQLEFALNPGINYQLGLNNNSNADLFRSNSNNNYPYNIGGLVNITGSSAGQNYYYWFYNWKVTRENCSSPRVAVTITVMPLPTVSLTATSSFVCEGEGEIILGGSPPGGIYGGTGVNGFIFNPSAGLGEHKISYQYTAPNGCKGSAAMTIEVNECTSLVKGDRSNEIIVYPNPVSGTLYISGENVSKARVTDLSGRLIGKYGMNSNKGEIETGNWSPGLYILYLNRSDGSAQVFRITKQ